MVTVVVLSLGTILISQSNAILLHAYGKYANRLGIQNWAEEKLWEAKAHLMESDFADTGDTSGRLSETKRDYDWRLGSAPADIKDLYTIKLDISWNNGSATDGMSRVCFVRKPKA